MADVKYYDYTKFLTGITSDLGTEFKALHTREEAQSLLEMFKDEYSAGNYDGLMDYDRKLRKIFSATVKDIADLIEADKRADDKDRRFPSAYNESQDDKIESEIDLFESAIGNIPSIKDIDKKFLDCLYRHYKEYKSSVDYIRRLVLNRLAVISPELIPEDENCSTRLLILRQFIKAFGWCENVKDGKRDEKKAGYRCAALRDIAGNEYGGDYALMAREIDESIFSRLAKAENNRILKLADALADAFFNNQHTTRESLYIFAIAFDMTISAENRESLKESDPDYQTDIRKNLFYDYYADNIINKRVRTNSEKYVDGYGINYKNMAEVIFLYYISRKDLTPLEKLTKAKALIETCKTSKLAKTAEEIENRNSDPETAGTSFFRRNFLTELVNLDESELKKYILENFECSSGGASTAAVNLAGVHKTAGRILKALIAESEDLPDELQYSIEISRCDPAGTAFEINDETRDFVKTIDMFNDRYFAEPGDDGMGFTDEDESYTPSERRDKSEKVKEQQGRIEFFNRVNYKGEDIVTRTDLLVYMSNYVVMKYIKEGIRGNTPTGFDGFYTDFANDTDIVLTYEDGSKHIFKGANAVLTEAGYQNISSKNIFDLIIIFLTFKKCHTADK